THRPHVVSFLTADQIGFKDAPVLSSRRHFKTAPVEYLRMIRKSFDQSGTLRGIQRVRRSIGRRQMQKRNGAPYVEVRFNITIYFHGIGIVSAEYGGNLVVNCIGAC